jgi:hypothetical protein
VRSGPGTRAGIAVAAPDCIAEYCEAVLAAGGASASRAGAGVGAETMASGSDRCTTGFGGCLLTGLCGGGGAGSVWSGGRVSGNGVGGGSASVTTGSGSVISCGGSAAMVEGSAAWLAVSGARTACGCDEDWPKTTSMPPFTGRSGGLGLTTNRTSNANTIAWPTVDKVSGSRIPLMAAYFSSETASVEEVDNGQLIDAACDIAVARGGVPLAYREFAAGPDVV